MDFPKGGKKNQARLRFENGEQIWVPVSELQKQPDDSYFLPLNGADLINQSGEQDISAPGEKIVIPVVAEELALGKRETITGGVRVTKHAVTHDQVVDEPGYTEEVHVERVPIDRPLDEPLEARQEGDTLIIPVMEEVLVVEKRLVLKEEIRITRRRKEVRSPQRVKLRREDVEVERLEPGSAG